MANLAAQMEFVLTSTETFGPQPGGPAQATMGVHIFAPDGQRIGQIMLPEICANLCFGGEKTKPTLHGRQPVPVRALCGYQKARILHRANK